MVILTDNDALRCFLSTTKTKKRLRDFIQGITALNEISQPL